MVLQIGYLVSSELELRFRRTGIFKDRFIFVDKASGKDFNRQEYQAMKKNIREGDLIYVDALDRLGRNYDGIIEEWKNITRTLKADIVVLENEALFNSRKFRELGDLGKLLEDQFLSLLSYVAEQERMKIRKRQAEGIAAAKSKGKHLGRPKAQYPKQWPLIYTEWKDGKNTAVKAFNALGMKKPTFYKLVKQYERENAKKQE